MHHFFVEPSQIEEGMIHIIGNDVNHMKNVLRMRVGEETEISDGTGSRYLCTVEELNEEQVLLKIQDFNQDAAELPSRIYLFQGLPKADKMELIIQKAVELGVYMVIPTEMKRCVVRLDEKKAAKKVARYQAVSESAAKQSGRSVIPEVHPVMSFKDALEFAGELDVILLPYEKAENMEVTRKAIDSIRPGESVGLFIGPEGGFEGSEIQAALDAGARVITLGKRILRTETAGMTVLSILGYHLEP